MYNTYSYSAQDIECWPCLNYECSEKGVQFATLNILNDLFFRRMTKKWF